MAWLAQIGETQMCKPAEAGATGLGAHSRINVAWNVGINRPNEPSETALLGLLEWAGGLPVRSPQRRGVPTNRLREGPASPPNQRARQAVGFDEHTNKKARQGRAGLKWGQSFLAFLKGLAAWRSQRHRQVTRALAWAGPLTKRRAEPLVSVSGGGTKKPRQFATGLSRSPWACR